MIVRAVIIVLLAGLVAVPVADSAPDGSAVSAKTKPRPKPKPKNVKLSLASARAQTATVGEDGGRIVVSAARTRLTLTIPKGALETPTAVTLTPLSRLRGLAKISLVAGVQITPDGTALVKPATLTIAGAKAKAARGLAWFGTGKDVSRYPSKRAGSTIEIRLAHFSGAAVATGPASAWDSVRGLVPALRSHYASEVKPVMNRALRYDQIAGVAIAAAFGFLREVQLLGLDKEFKAEEAEIRELLPRILQNALDKASERCYAHDLSMLDRMLQIERFAQLLGIKLTGERFSDRLERCARFELRFETTLTGSATSQAPYQFRFTSVVNATVPVGLKSDLSAAGEAQLAYPTWSTGGTWPMPDYVINYRSVGVRLGEPFRVLALTIEFPETGAGPPKIFMRVEPGTPHEAIEGCNTYNGMCGTDDVYTVYSASFRGLYAGQKDAKGGFRIDDWTYQGGESWAKRVFQRTATFSAPVAEDAPGAATFTVTEDTTFLLRHIPLK